MNHKINTTTLQEQEDGLEQKNHLKQVMKKTTATIFLRLSKKRAKALWLANLGKGR
jgi:hypothetical protein